MNNKSRPEQRFVFYDYPLNIIPTSKKRVHSSHKLSSKSKKKSPTKSSPTSTQKKYFPGEFIYDTKGQMAEIKYIGECHKGPGTWFGIEFIDGTLGKHNGTINGHTYFRGEYRRCDMIRGDKIRSKASPNKSKKKKKNKYKSPQKHKPMHRLRRSNSDLLQMESISLADMSYGCSDNYFKKRKNKNHKRVVSQPSSFEKEWSYSTNRMNNKSPLYKPKSKQIKTVKKEKYKGNKYILAMEQQTEKRINERIGFIKTEKQRVKKQKHERSSSKVQQILKQKQLEKECLNKLNAENKLKELQRIQLAKQKSKKKLKIKSNNRIRSRSNSRNYKLNRNRNTSNVPSIIVDNVQQNTLKISKSTTPLADDMQFEFKLTPIPAEHNTCFDNDSMDEMDENDEEELVHTPDLIRSYSDSDVTHTINDTGFVLGKNNMHKMDAMFPVNSDSAILLHELETINSDEIEYPSPIPITMEIPMKKIISVTPTKPKKNVINVPFSSLSETDDMKDLENDTSFYFPLHNKKQRSNSFDSLKRTKSTPIFNAFDDKGTDYWINKYNKMNERLNNYDKQIELINKNNTQNINISKPEPIQMSKSTEILEIKQQTNGNNNEENDSFYGAMSSGIKQRSQSLASPSLLKRTESAPVIVNDDKGTDYWIKQYNKANKSKKKSKSKTKRKSKSKRKKSRSKTVTKLVSTKNKHIISKSKPKPKPLSLPKSIPILSNKASDKSPYFYSDIDDNISDILTTTSTLSTLSNDPSLDLYINSTISSVNSTISSAESTPNDTTPNDIKNYSQIIDHQMIKNISYQSKYGVYPFQRKHENYINKKFTGIVRIGHRYLLRDGRIGIVRYINQTRFAPGTWYGFELDKSDGEHNGIVNNIKYFTCGNNYGTFVKKSQIAQYIGRDNMKSLSKNHLKHLNSVNVGTNNFKLSM